MRALRQIRRQLKRSSETGKPRRTKYYEFQLKLRRFEGYNFSALNLDASNLKRFYRVWYSVERNGKIAAVTGLVKSKCARAKVRRLRLNDAVTFKYRVLVKEKVKKNG